MTEKEIKTQITQAHIDGHNRGYAKAKEELEEQVEDWKADHKYNLELMKGLNNRISDLEKENAELKEKLKPENCLKLLAKEGYIKFTSDQLTKAKEIIKKLVNGVRVLNDPKVELTDCDGFLEEAEQFLKEGE